jgi:hypothetical protein
VGHFVKQSGRAIEQPFVHVVHHRDEQLSRLLGAVFEIRSAELAPGGRLGLPLRKLKRITRQFQSLEIGLGRHQPHRDELLHPAPQARTIIHQPRPFGIVFVHGAEKLLYSASQPGA